MDEYEIGQTYTFRGVAYVYKGGDPTDRGSWQRAGRGSEQPAPQSQSQPQPAGAVERFSQMVRDAARVGSSAATGHFGDEVSGALRGAGAFARQLVRQPTDVGAAADSARAAASEGTQQARAGVSEARDRLPGLLEFGAEVAPLAVLPAAAGQRAIARGGAGLLGTGARGAAVGGAEGQFIGMGSAEGSAGERAMQAVPEAALGVAGGGVLGGGTAAVNAVRRRASGRGPRVAEALRETTGVDDLVRASDDVEAVRQAARREFYGPLDEMELDHPELLSWLRDPSHRAGRTVRNSLPEVFAGKRPPTFRELQKVRESLSASRVLDEGELARLNRLMDEATDGGASRADRAYAQAMEPVEALQEGRKFYNKSAADIEMAQRGLSPEALRSFRTGQLHEIIRRLEKRESGSLSWLRNFMDAGPETLRVARTLFPSDEAFEEFTRAANQEQSAQAVSRVVRKYLPGFVAGAAAGAGASRLMAQEPGAAMSPGLLDVPPMAQDATRVNTTAPNAARGDDGLIVGPNDDVLDAFLR